MVVLIADVVVVSVVVSSFGYSGGLVMVVLNGDELLVNTSYCYWIEKGRHKKSGAKYKYITRFVIVGISNIILF